MVMDNKTAEILRAINNEFYRSHHDSFSKTRTSPWNGWKRCVAALGLAGIAGASELSVLDLACGNLRFATFLEDALPEVALSLYAVDNCDEMVPALDDVEYLSIDILERLDRGVPLLDGHTLPPCDLSVTFGFMHHIPLKAHREEVLRAMVEQTRSGGFVIVSFWQFLNNEDLAKKAQVTHERALKELGLPALEKHDYLLGWKERPDTYRYCHSFSDDEIDDLIKTVSDKANLHDRFVSDGRTDNLNTYVILQVR